MSKVVDIIFEVVFPEIAAHVPVGGRRDPKLLRVAPGLNLRGVEACLKVLAVKLRTTPGRGTERDWSAGCVADAIVDGGKTCTCIGMRVGMRGGRGRGKVASRPKAIAGSQIEPARGTMWRNQKMDCEKLPGQCACLQLWWEAQVVGREMGVG